MISIWLATSGNRAFRISEIAFKLFEELIKCISLSVSKSNGCGFKLLLALLSCIVGIPSRFCNEDGPSYESTKYLRTILSLLKFINDTDGRIDYESFVHSFILAFD